MAEKFTIGEKFLIMTETVEVNAVEISEAYVGDRKFTATIRTNLITEQRELLIYSGEEIFFANNF